MEIDPLKEAFDVALGMMYLHAQEMIHHDLKPANILVCQQ